MAVIIDGIFVYVLTFALAFIWLKFYIESNFICFCISIIVTVIVKMLINKLSGRRKMKKKVKLLAGAKNLALCRYFYRTGSASLVIGNAFEKCSFEVTYLADRLLLTKDGENTLVVPCFDGKTEPSARILLSEKLAERFHAKRITVFAEKADPSLRSVGNFIDREVKIYDVAALYGFLEAHDALPEISDGEKSSDGSTPAFLSRALTRKRSGYYFASSFFLAITAFFTFYPLYHVIVATITFFLAMYSRFNGRFNTVETEDFLL